MARRWTKEHEAALARILASMRRQATAFADTSREAVEERRSRPFASWCHTYLPHWFEREDAPFHEAADARRNIVGLPTCECWARGTAKTTRYSIADVLFDILNRERCFIILGAKTLDSAAEKANIIRQELKHNARLSADYGDVEPEAVSDAEDDFTALGCRVRCLGTGQSLRGAVHAGHRPQKFIGDDLEDKTISRSREREQKLWDWLMGDVYPALEGAGQEAVFRNLCNMYGRHCLAVRFRQMAGERDAKGRPLAAFYSYPLIGDDGESAWPGRYSTDAVKRAMAIIGTSLARTEYLCLMADDEAPYQPDWFKPFDSRTLSAAELGKMVKVAYNDPSATAKETSDFKSWIVLGRTPGTPETYCLHAWVRRSTPEEQIRELFRIVEKYPGVHLACERNGFQTLLWNLLVLTCEREGRAVPSVRGIFNMTNKLDRLMQWQAEHQLGRCLYDPREGDQQRLVDQWCDLPTGKHDDGPDAWDGARRILDAVCPPRVSTTVPDPTRAELLREAGYDKGWCTADNDEIWDRVEVG